MCGQCWRVQPWPERSVPACACESFHKGPGWQRESGPRAVSFRMEWNGITMNRVVGEKRNGGQLLDITPPGIPSKADRQISSLSSKGPPLRGPLLPLPSTGLPTLGSGLVASPAEKVPPARVSTLFGQAPATRLRRLIKGLQEERRFIPPKSNIQDLDSPNSQTLDFKGFMRNSVPTSQQHSAV